jgi:CubicO group peptidase (beta-lactamase class C family)
MASVAVEHLLDVAFDDVEHQGLTLAVVAMGTDGTVLAERYGPTAGPDETLISWSMAKSFTHLAAGVAGVDPGRDGLFDAWSDDPRAAITIDDLLRMRDGLVWNEDYVDAGGSDVIEMLFGSGGDDVVGYAADRAAEVPHDTRWRYSSGTTNLLADVVRRTVGVERGDDWRRWLIEAVCRPAGIRSADPRLDAAGSFVASSYLYATACDFARFGLVYLHQGDGLVGPDWVAEARRPTDGVDEPDRGYGAQWWLWPDHPDWLGAHGYETQRTLVAYDRDLVVVRLGKTPEELGDAHVDAWLVDLVDAL